MAQITLINLENGESAMGYFSNEKKMGSWAYHNAFGKLIRIENYNASGELHGFYAEFNSNGFLSSEKWYENDQLNGPQRTYFNGNKVREWQIINNKLDGPYMTFFQNGNPDTAGIYIQGFKANVWVTYYENGKLKSSTSYNLLGQKEGLQRYYAQDGSIIVQYSIKDDKLDGKYTEYYKNGGIQLEGNYVNGLKEGNWFQYDASGQKIKTRKYKNDVEE